MEGNGGQVTIFISYSHAARHSMLAFRKHLEGQLFGKATVWSDHAIPRGDQWENRLLAQLNHADVALVLVTPDFLASKWCRRELEHIVAMQKARRMKKVFWVQVEPSGWRHTELARLQSWESNLGTALSEIHDVNARERAIATICEEIASEVTAIGGGLHDDLLLVRQIVMDQSIERGIVVDSEIPEGRGNFVIACRGRRGEADVAIKVIQRTPIQQLAESFRQTLESRQILTHQCFIKVLDHFPADSGNEQYTVVVEEFVGKDAIRLDALLKQQTFSIDEAATAIRRAAEALKQFHERSLDFDSAYGLMTPRHIYYDARAQKLLLPAVGVSSFLWSKLGWERFSAWQDADGNAAAYVAPEQRDSHEATHLTDQYMLGQLAFQMLEGRLPFDIRRPLDVLEKEEFWENPQTTVKGNWPAAHQAFANVIFKMLDRVPARRWRNFDEIIARLRVMDDESRALAKLTYLGSNGSSLSLGRDEAFFRDFYREFFARAPGAERKFDRKNTDQHRKLMESMVAVLNFRPGNEPTALTAVLEKHLDPRIKPTPAEVDQFRDAFLHTLESRMPGTMSDKERAVILNAWRDLFAPVVEYFKQRL